MTAVIYARFSSQNQREESIEGQLRECSDFAARKGYTVINSYCDRAISGKSAANRPEFMQMIEDSKQHLFDAVLVWKIDRFSRDKYDSVFYKNALKKNGVSVISATEPIDDSAEGQLMESIFEGFSVYYIKDLSAKVSRGMTENALKGKFNGGNPTFGYIIDEEKRFQIDPTTAPIVAEIFTRYSDGETVKSIVEYLNSTAMQTQQGKPPTQNFVMHLLKNRRYLGEYKFRDTVIVDAFEPIITQELFDKCQQRMAANQRKPAHFKPLPEPYILADKLFCGYCGAKMSGESGRSATSRIYRYYKCGNAKRHKSCEKKAVVKVFIEDLVIVHAMHFLQNDELVTRLVNAAFEYQQRENVALAPLQTRINKTDAEIQNIMTAIKAGIITKSTKSELERLETEKENLEIAIAKQQIVRPLLSKKEIRFWLTKFRDTDLADDAQKRKFIETFVNCVYVYDDKAVLLFNYKDGEQLVDLVEATKIAKGSNSSGGGGTGSIGEGNSSASGGNAKKTTRKRTKGEPSFDSSPLDSLGDPAEIRTPDTLLKRQVLCRLSYWVKWLGWQGSNLRMPESKSGALPLGDIPLIKTEPAGRRVSSGLQRSRILREQKDRCLALRPHPASSFPDVDPTKWSAEERRNDGMKRMLS